MTRTLVNVRGTGFEDLISELNDMSEQMRPAIKKGMEEGQKELIKIVQQNYLSYGGKVNDFIYSSIGKSTAYSKTNSAVLGTVGVYHMDAVFSRFGKSFNNEGKRADLVAPQIAYWMEFGTSRLRSGGRKRKGSDYIDEELVTISPKPFVSSALSLGYEAYYETFKETFNLEMGQ